jgi:hypothetical protein
MFKVSPASLQTFIDTPNNKRLTLTPSVIPRSNYVVMVSDEHFLNYLYISIVHTVVLFQGLVGVHCETQHVKS